jgi:hypothetical protein
MSLRQKVNQHIDQYPETTFESLVKSFPDNNKGTLRKYYYDNISKKSVETTEQPKTERTSDPKGELRPIEPSLRQQVFAYLKGNPDATVDELCQRFPQRNRKTLREYRHKWLNRQQPSGEQDATTRQHIFTHLDQHPNDNLNDLKKVFPHYPKTVTAFRQWKQAHQAQPEPKPAQKTPLGSEAPTSSVDQDKIQSLMKVIDNQKAIIESQKSKINQFKQQLMSSPRITVADIARFLKKKLFGK